MTYKELKKQIKEEQKSLARAIKKGKSARKPSNRNEENRGFYDALYWNQGTRSEIINVERARLSTIRRSFSWVLFI